MTASQPPPTVHAAIVAAREECIGFLRREAARRTAAAIEESGPEAEMWASDSASFATAAGLLTVAAAAWEISPGGEEAGIEAEIRADERKRCAAICVDQSAAMSRRGEYIAASTASYLSGLIHPQGPVMGAQAAGGIT